MINKYNALDNLKAIDGSDRRVIIMGSSQRFRVPDDTCPNCYYNPLPIIKRGKVARRDEYNRPVKVWMLIRQCPNCGIRTMKKDPNQEDENG